MQEKKQQQQQDLNFHTFFKIVITKSKHWYAFFKDYYVYRMKQTYIGIKFHFQINRRSTGR